MKKKGLLLNPYEQCIISGLYLVFRISYLVKDRNGPPQSLQVAHPGPRSKSSTQSRNPSLPRRIDEDEILDMKYEILFTSPELAPAFLSHAGPRESHEEQDYLCYRPQAVYHKESGQDNRTG